jgi:hypothetical protein
MASLAFERWLLFSGARLFLAAALIWGVVWGFTDLPLWGLVVLPAWFAAYRTFQIRAALAGLKGSLIVFGVFFATATALSFVPCLLIRAIHR